MNTILFVHRKVSSVPSFSVFRSIARRVMLFLERPAIAGVAAAFVALGVLLYIAMVLMGFDFGVRLRDTTAAYTKESENLMQMEARAREQEAGFVERHRLLIQNMREIVVLKYLTRENAAVSEARGGTLSRP